MCQTDPRNTSYYSHLINCILQFNFTLRALIILPFHCSKCHLKTDTQNLAAGRPGSQFPFSRYSFFQVLANYIHKQHILWRLFHKLAFEIKEMKCIIRVCKSYKEEYTFSSTFSCCFFTLSCNFFNPLFTLSLFS